MEEREWLRLLTKRQVLHLVIDADCLTAEQFVATRIIQKGPNGTPCTECRGIALRMGIEQ